MRGSVRGVEAGAAAQEIPIRPISPLRDGAEVLRYAREPGPTGQAVDVSAPLEIAVAFEHDGPAKGQPVLGTLQALVQQVDIIVSILAARIS